MRLPDRVVWLDLAALLLPEVDEGGLVIAHDDPGIRTPNKMAAAKTGY